MEALSQFESDAPLKDGSLVHIRPSLPTDGTRFKEFLDSLSQESFVFRFFGAGLDRDRIAQSMLPGDGRFTLTAERQGRLVAAASYFATNPTVAEIGVAIVDAYQGRGLGTILIGQLAEAAALGGIQRFEAFVLPENHRMIQVIRDLGFPVEMAVEPDVVRIAFPTSRDTEVLARFENRETTAARAAVSELFAPRSIAVIGASRDRASVSGTLFANILEGGFQGVLYPVNPSAAHIQAVVAYPSVVDCPGPVDLAFIVVPRGRVLDVARQCAQKGVRSVVVISSGFAEMGPEGAQAQEEVVEVCRQAGCRLVGPNCMGIINTDPAVRLNGQFSPLAPARGRIGFMSQSGAMGIAAMDVLDRQGLGLSKFVSVGNKADLSGNDLLEYWESDPETGVILLYLESFGNPRKFARIARRVSRSKPIVAVKAGRTSAGARGARSHTAALLTASDLTVDALFRQAGVIRTDTLQELFDVVALLAYQPLPVGNGVGIITNAGGSGVIAADACEAHGLHVPELAPVVREALQRTLPDAAAVSNPVDMTAAGGAGNYRMVMHAVAQDPAVDALLVIYTHAARTDPRTIPREIAQAAADLPRPIPVVVNLMAIDPRPHFLETERGRIPVYAYPEEAVAAVARAHDRAKWLARPVEPPASFAGIQKDQAAALVSQALGRGSEWLSSDETSRLLSCYGIHPVRSSVGSSPEDVARIASEFGRAVAVKAVAPNLLHKTEVGGVALDLANPEAARAAAERIRSNVAAHGFVVQGYLVQEMVGSSREMFVGMTSEANFGPVIGCGAGGVLVELVRDVAFRLTPISSTDAREMVRSLKTFPLLDGFRQGPLFDVAALEEVLLRTSALAEDIPEVVEMDLNPVMVQERGQGAVVADARVRVGRVHAPLPLGSKKR